jgi:Flp pilus assembly protein TadG
MRLNQLSFSHRGKRGRIFRRGSAVLDAALVFPILLSLTFGTVEYGHYFYWKHTLQGAAREGARAAITPTAVNADVTTAVTNAMSAAGIPAANYTVKIRNAADTADVTVNSVTAGTGILVKVYATWGNVGMRPLGLIGAGKQVTGTTVMRKAG